MGMASHMLVACCWIQSQSKAVEHLPVPTPDHTQAGVLCFVAAHRTARKKKKKKKKKNKKKKKKLARQASFI
jgi:thiamine biosynthesis protein ThiC